MKIGTVVLVRDLLPFGHFIISAAEIQVVGQEITCCVFDLMAHKIIALLPCKVINGITLARSRVVVITSVEWVS